MNTPDKEEPRFCGNCGSQLLPDKRCPNKCTAVTYVNDSSPTYTRYSIPPTQPGLPNYTPQPPNQNKSNKMYLLVIAFLLVIILIGAGVFAGVLIGKNSTQANIGVTPTPLSAKGISPTTATTTFAAPVSTTIPAPTPSPTSSLPCAVNVGTWAGGSSDWKTLNGMLINDGTRFMGTGINGPTIVAPCQVEGTSDYAVEARMQVVSTASYQGGTCFGITVRGSSTTDSWQGYQGDIDIDGCSSEGGHARILGKQFPNDFSLARAPYSPGTSWHTYRMEVKGNSVQFIIDGSVVVALNDNQFLSGGQVGLWSYGVQLNISSFKIVAL